MSSAGTRWRQSGVSQRPANQKKTPRSRKGSRISKWPPGAASAKGSTGYALRATIMHVAELRQSLVGRPPVGDAVWYEPISSTRFKLNAEIPSLPVANNQQAVNHTLSSVRVRSKIVPAVTELRAPHSQHMKRPSPRRQPFGRTGGVGNGGQESEVRVANSSCGGGRPGAMTGIALLGFQL